MHLVPARSCRTNAPQPSCALFVFISDALGCYLVSIGRHCRQQHQSQVYPLADGLAENALLRYDLLPSSYKQAAVVVLNVHVLHVHVFHIAILQKLEEGKK